jgi:hypothetical protein
VFNQLSFLAASIDDLLLKHFGKVLVNEYMGARGSAVG